LTHALRTRGAVVSSFIATLDIPWPTLFYSIMAVRALPESCPCVCCPCYY
jgi:hypothetical protein